MLQTLRRLSTFAHSDLPLKQQAVLLLLHHSIALGRTHTVAAQALKTLQCFEDELFTGRSVLTTWYIQRPSPASNFWVAVQHHVWQGLSNILFSLPGLLVVQCHMCRGILQSMCCMLTLCCMMLLHGWSNLPLTDRKRMIQANGKSCEACKSCDA